MAEVRLVDIKKIYPNQGGTKKKKGDAPEKKHNLQITDEGKTALEQWIGCCHEAEEMMLENFSEEERRQFFSFLSRAYDNLNQSKGGKIA